MSDLTKFFVENFENLAPIIFYLIVGIIIFVETGVLLGFFLPGDSLLFAAGIVASTHGNINPVTLAIVVFMAAFLGDQVGFVFGRVIGRPYLERRQSERIHSERCNIRITGEYRKHFTGHRTIYDFSCRCHYWDVHKF